MSETAGSSPPREADGASGTGFRLTLRHLWLLVPFALVAWVVSRDITDNSFLWHVRAGTAQLDAGEVLTADPFSFTAGGEPWRTQSWLVELGYGYLERTTGGLDWVPWMLFLLVSLTLAAVGVAVYRSVGGRIVPVAAVLLLVGWQGVRAWVPRPVVVSYLMLALVVVVLQAGERRAEWTLPGLHWLWAAIHGSFVLGIALVVLEAVRRRSRRLALAAAGSLVVASLTAHGIGVWQILIDFLGAREALDVIQEWTAPELVSFSGLAYAVTLAALLWAAVSGRIRRRDLVVVLPWALFGLLANRNLYPAAIVLAPYVARALPLRPEPERTDSVVVNYVFVAVMAIFAVIGLARPVSVDPDLYPPGALEALDEAPTFHGDGFAGFIIYAGWPEHRVFVDDRAELYGAGRFRELLELRLGRGYREAFARYGIVQAVVQPNWPIEEDLREDGWIEVWRGEELVVLRAP